MNAIPSNGQSRAALWTGRVLSALIVLLMLFGASMSLRGGPEVEAGFSKYGYPRSSARPIAVAQIASAVLYAIPQTAVLGAVLMTGYLGGAVSTHVRASEPFTMAVVVGVLAWLALFLRDPRIRALLPLRRRPDTT